MDGVHAIILHVFTKYFKNYFDYIIALRSEAKAPCAKVAAA